MLLEILALTAVTKDTLVHGDTAMVITTVCAPICSSVVQVYAIDNKEWKLARTLLGDSTLVFPEAYFEQQELRWKDNTSNMLDEEGK